MTKGYIYKPEPCIWLLTSPPLSLIFQSVFFFTQVMDVNSKKQLLCSVPLGPVMVALHSYVDEMSLHHGHAMA